MNTKYVEKTLRIIFIIVFLIGTVSVPSRGVMAQVPGKDVFYTTDADFDLGTLVSVNHDAPYNDQLQLDTQTKPFPFINVAASGRGTVVRSNTETGTIVGEYRTAPDGRGLNPSRTTVDLFGNVWTANRQEAGLIDGIPHGSAVKIGLIVGGTRVNEMGDPDPTGGYLAPPFGYNTCADRNGDGLIRTSSGLGDILDWPDITDGQGGVDGLVQDAEDECVLIYQRLHDAEQARHVSVDADNNVWVGGYPFDLRMFYKLDSATGAILDSFNARDIGCGGYGGLIDGNGVLWSVGGALLRYDPATGTGFCIHEYGYGLGIDTNGYIWMSLWEGGIVKIDPDGNVLPGYPKPIFPPSTTTTSLAIPSQTLELSSPAATELNSDQGTAQPSPVQANSPEPQKLLTSSQTLTINAAAVIQSNGSAAFQVAPVDDWVGSSSAWTPGANITLEINDGSGVVYSDSQTADSDGHFNFNFGGMFDVQRGHVVTVSDGTTTKTHTVAYLYVDSVNVTDDTVSGRADAGSSVEVWVHDDGNLTVSADGAGNWTADFSSLTDITYLSDGGSQQVDADGDSTGVWWGAPRFQVAPVDDWIESFSPWTPGATISLTIADGSGVVYSDSQTADVNGRFNFYLGGVFDIQRGHEVTISDGTTTKAHTVTNLYVDSVDVTADTVLGRADAGTDVGVYVHGNGWTITTADGAGNWTADFSGQTDLTYFSDGGSNQMDDDGDFTGVWWAAPRFQVAPEDDWVGSSSSWTPGATISLTIEDGSGVLHSDSQTADSNGNFNFEMRDVFDLQRGHVVTVSDGVNTKTHTVMELYVDGIDPTADTVFGRATAGTDVEVWVHGDGGLTATADGSGNWTADFTGMTDITYLSDGGSQQFDDDGDATGVWWTHPSFRVTPDDDWIGSENRWIAGATITLTIEDGSGVVYSDSTTADAGGNFHFDLWDSFDIQRGHEVTVSDGTTSKTHTVTNLYVDGVDVTADTVSGRADAGTDVYIWEHGNGWTTATADGSGNWTADFSGMTDLTYLSEGGSGQMDADGDSTRVHWSAPRFQVAPEDDWVSSWSRWTPGTTVTLTIEDGSSVVHSDSQTVDPNGNFYFELRDVFDLQRGHIVIVSDGVSTKIHTVMDLFVDGIDPTADTVFGRADAGTEVEVWVHGDGWTMATADGAGNWTADFSGMTDLTYLSDGGSQQMDKDGDSTGVWWAMPRFQVAPDDNWVSSWGRWTPGATISLTIEDGGSVVYSDSQTADPHGNFNFELWDVFNLQRGHVVTVSDGVNTKTHTVMALYVDGVDAAADTVFGRADAGTEVDVWVHGDGWTMATADGSGNWIADFFGQTDLTYLSDGGSQQMDEDGDATGVWWASPLIQVSPDQDWVESRNRWAAGATVTLTIEDSTGPVYTDSQTVEENGNFGFWDMYDLMTGHLVTVSDGTTTRIHTVTDIQVTNIDTDDDQVSGTANPGAPVQVWASTFDHGSGRWVTADASGNWLADFSVPADDQPAYDITSATRLTADEYDDDGDSTRRHFGPPSMNNRGVAVTPIDNNVWVANSAYGTVTRLDNDGNVLKAIDTGTAPTGVAVDAAGKVWATNMVSHTAVRIDPNAGADGLGAVDLTVDLGPDAWPYNYSDMTGAVVVGSTSPQGFWTVVQDSETPGFEWGRITWNTESQGSEPPGTEIVVEARAADTEAGLGGQPFQPVLNGDLFSILGRFIEVRVTLKASPGGVSPVLSDIRIQPHVLYVDIDIKPGSYPNSINCENEKEVIAVAILTTDEFDALTIDHTRVTFEGASEIHIVKKTGEPQRHEEDVDLDGDTDLVFHFQLRDTVLTCDSTEGFLSGMTVDNLPWIGSDSVRMIDHEACLASPAGLVSWWPGDESPEDIADNNDGILFGDATYAPGMVGQAFAFDGDGDYVMVPRAPALDVGSQLTIDFWMKADPSNLMEDCCQGLVTTDFYELAIAPGAGSVPGVMLMVAADGWVHSSDLGDGGYPLIPGEWYHVAGVYDGANVSFYVNGQLVVDPPPQTGSIIPMLQTSFLAIGSEDGRTNEPDLIGNRYFHGLIDEVDLFNRSLSEAEIQAIYNAGSAGKCKE